MSEFTSFDCSLPHRATAIIALAATLAAPGDVYIADTVNNDVVKVNPAHHLSIICR